MSYGYITYASPMAGNFWRSTVAWLICFVVTVAISLVTKPKPAAELVGLVWGTQAKSDGIKESWYKRPVVLAWVLTVLTLGFNILFW